MKKRMKNGAKPEQKTNLLPVEQPVYRHENPKCKGCPYGNKQYCVGICWKDVYESVLKKRS